MNRVCVIYFCYQFIHSFPGLQKTLTLSEKDLCKYFEPGNHVKVVSGAQEGVTGMVLTVQGHLVNLVSDTTKEVVSDEDHSQF